jgi:hypothetical protein
MSEMYGSVFVKPDDECKITRQAIRLGSVSLHFEDRTSAEVAALLRNLADELDPPRRAYGWTLP